MTPTISGSDIPWLSADQMREVDRLMIEVYHIELFQMMENAGRNLAHLAKTRFLADPGKPHRVVVMAGAGGNGGGALVAARRLANWGVEIRVLLAVEPARIGGVPGHQLRILHELGLTGAEGPADPTALPAHCDLILDGLLGYSLHGDPRGRFGDLIRWANQTELPILSLDTPSGLDVTTGKPADPCIHAAATLTLALPKTGLRGNPQVGELYLADISVPPELYAQPSLGLKVGSIFAQGDILAIAGA